MPYKDGQYEEIFGGRKKISIDAGAKLPKDKPIFSDCQNAKEILKIGKEINRMKRLDGANIQRIEKMFRKDADALFVKKQDRAWVKECAREITERLKNER